MKKLLVLILFVLIYNFSAKAQYFQTGQDPSQIRWRQINTLNFQVIYPEEFEIQAQRISYVLEKVYDFGSKSLGFRPHKVSVVLHTRTVKSNGLMAWAPKRIELFTTPHQQIYAQDWLEQLALHEFRHLVQMDKIQTEMPGIVKAILGEQATAIIVGTYLPFWFLEGDAVVTETALSNSGRGRLASFSMEHRAQLAEKGKYSFDKAYLGSYKDFVPDHYKLGYWMVGKIREKFGPQIWANALKKIGKQPYSLTPLNSSLKKSSGFTTKQMYSGIFDKLTQEWKETINKKIIDSISIVSPRRNSYTEYLYPEFFQDTLIFAYRTSMDDIGRFVIISPDKSEKVIYTPGKIFEESVSLQGNLIIWAERRADLRWSHSDRSVIHIYNIENKVLQEIKNENKLFSPVISPDLKSFAAVEVDPGNNFYLSVFDLTTGELKDRFKTDDNQYFFTPCWDEKAEKLYVVCLSAKGKYLASADLKSKLIRPLTENTFANLKNPVFSKGLIYFSADFSGTDNLYSIDAESNRISEIASVRFGADYPSISGTKVLFSHYNSAGYQLATIQIDQIIRKKEVENIQLSADSLAYNLAAQENGIPDFSNPDSVKYESKKYSKIGHLFNFHSWAPAYIDVNSYEIRPGVSLFSQNKLGTAETRLGYDYNVADRTGRYKLGFSYSGLFPEINAELSFGNEASNYFQITNTVNKLNQIIKSDTILQRFSWKELTADFDVRLPLNFSKGKYSRIFYPEVKYTLNQVLHNGSTPENFYSGNYHALAYRLYVYNLLHQSTQNLMPRWGQQFDLIYRYTPFIGNNLGTLAGIQSVLYFPGLTKNSGLRVYQGYQEKSFTHSYNFSNFVHFPRGFSGYQNNKVYSLSADYKFPICYPDINFGKLAYIKRLKSSVFYDYAWLSVPVADKNGTIFPNDHEMQLKSLGFELTSEVHFLRFFAPFELGFRSVYRPQFKDFTFDLLVSVDFNGF
ncbi:MAG: hypothetical protein Q8S54_10190 [Bacteroidota bacterium]|nr:hypothetical protein [Odoribacter sp.]MDP3643544.1 hypothetical protein [Bacteroidota bacterium]